MTTKAFFSYFHRLVPLSYLTGAKCMSTSSNIDTSVLSVDVLQDKYKGVVVLGMNRAKAKNALNKSLAYSLDNILDGIKFDRNTRVVILRSLVPGVFCAGADLKERVTLSETEVEIFVDKLRSMMTKIERLPLPVIAAIDGVALGGGLEMALAADVRVASHSSKLGLVETRLAILPGAGGTQRLPRLVGPSLAKELIFTSRILSGKEAKSIGLVNHVVEDNEKGDSAFIKALSISSEILPNGPIGIKMAKLSIDRGIQVSLDNGYAIEKLCYNHVIPTKDRLEGLKAFAEKRKPNYIGE